jgi:hypothetical protein
MEHLDWNLIFAGGAFALALVTSISSTVYFIVSLIVKPLKEDVEEIKKIIGNVKSETDLSRMIDLSIAKHKDDCLT